MLVFRKEDLFFRSAVMTFHTYSSECPFKSIEDIKDKKITIMGLGLNGGGEAAARFFLNKGAYVTVTDMKTTEQLAPTLERLNNDDTLDHSRLTYHLGGHDLADFETADCVIKNPGVKFEGNKYLAAAKAIETDLSIFLRFTDCPIIAVTGSKGKSSTVSAIYYGLQQAGFNAFLGGNITVSPLTFFDKVNSNTPVVIEFSSWQLADLRGRGVLKPHIAVITKIVPDHQNWYGNMQDYVADKRLIYADQTADDFSIFDAGEDEPGTGPDCGGTWGDLFARETRAKVIRYNTKTQYSVDFDSLLVPGEHMKLNAQNAATVLQLMGVEKQRAKEILQTWPGIAHRLQFFHEWKGFKFYNDSAATVPEAAAAATQAFGRPVILLTGGTEKGLELDKLTEVLTGSGGKNSISIEQIYLLAGTATDKIIPELDKTNTKYNGPYNSLNEMLSALKNNLTNNDVHSDIVVFSPGATSFGMFNNEFDRGEKFMKAVETIYN
jgi:UDP-N-acetylmuramoylalanine--D-glutamate ligase